MNNAFLCGDFEHKTEEKNLIVSAINSIWDLTHVHGLEVLEEEEYLWNGK